MSRRDQVKAVLVQHGFQDGEALAAIDYAVEQVVGYPTDAPAEKVAADVCRRWRGYSLEEAKESQRFGEAWKAATAGRCTDPELIDWLTMPESELEERRRAKAAIFDDGGGI